MEICNICCRLETNLIATYVITKQEKRKDVHICRSCIERICDTKMGEWFSIAATDEMVKLPNVFYMKA